ncbi:replication-relaxation family protein [Streptomyces sp. NPDC058321]|uniref:replication-relaxation family protein n=1 Tax=unclassified Streptomyces TaxID=2593676 RepID=UPI002E7FF9DF|nr:replication-relaxation family protein [Streptomyces sp. NBC_00569]WUB97949.1 replication-relaxation family protein [Streptomyces sp. NBC_00569]
MPAHGEEDATPAQRKEARTASHRAAANDLRRHGLSVDGGRTRAGEEVRLLTAAGLAAAAVELGRAPEEMGGLPKGAGRTGAAHAMTVNETVLALIRPQPDLSLIEGEPDEVLAAARTAAEAPSGVGTIASYATEVALPVSGTWKSPGLGSARADAVVTAPEHRMPLLFIEADNCHEDAVTIAAKFDRYARFYQRTAPSSSTPMALSTTAVTSDLVRCMCSAPLRRWRLRSGSQPEFVHEVAPALGLAVVLDRRRPSTHRRARTRRPQTPAHPRPWQRH